MRFFEPLKIFFLDICEVLNDMKAYDAPPVDQQMQGLYFCNPI